jgi:hypothetical protein
MSGVNGGIKAALRAHLEAFAASARESVASDSIAAAGSTFTASSALFSGFRVGDSIATSGFAQAANNGSFLVVGASASTLTVDRVLVDEEAGAAVIIEARWCPPGRIAWPNEPFDPNAEEDPLAGAFWLRTTFLPGRPTTVSLGAGGMNRQVGAYQIDCFHPKHEGDAAADAMADAIASHFLRGMVLEHGGVKVMITESGSEPARDEPAWYRAPVRIGYQATTLNE